jgi:kumamolisin
MATFSDLRGSVLGGIALLAALAGTVTGPTAQETSRSTVEADAALARLGDRVVGMVEPGQRVRFGLQLPYHDQAGLDVLDQRLFTPGDPLFHQFLTSQEFNQRFAPSQEEYDALIELAQRSGLTVKETHSGRTLLSVEAPAARVQQLFGVQMRQVQTFRGEAYVAADRPASLPAEYAALGARVVSLNQRPAHTHLVRRTDLAPAAPAGTPASQPRAITVPDPGPVGGYGPGDIQTAYNTIGLSQTGAGQTIALYELSTATYTDAQTYLSQFGLPAATYNNISFVNVDGGTTDNSGSGEVMLDIEMVLALVPNIGNLIVYTAPNGSGILDLYTRIADDNLAKTVSTSWGSPEQSGGDGSEASYQKMVTQGQALFAASGDSGAYDNCSTTSFGALTVDDPAVQTNVTGVGGTSVTLNSTTSAYSSETTWGNTGESSNCLRGAGGGGGISQFTAIPSYQGGVVSSAPTGEFSTTMRNVPDVSLNAEPATGYAVYETGSGGWTVFGGTSAAAPLWASFWTQIDQALIARGGSSAGFANPTIYHLAENATSYANDFHDIKDNSTNLHYHAVANYDTATGWGSFNGAKLLQDVVTYLAPAVPPAPTNVAAAASGSTQVTLSWTAAPGATGYNVYKSTKPGQEAIPAALSVSGGSSTGGTVTGLTTNQIYYFVVQAVNAAGHSGNSTEVHATVGSVPAAPTGVTATASGTTQVTLSWTAVAGATGYNVYKSTGPGREALPAALSVSGGSSTGGIVTGLTTNQIYYFVVQAVNAVGHSGNSAEVHAAVGSVPTAPTGVAAAASGSTQVTLSWTAVSGATGYNVYKSTGPGQEALPAALSVSGGSSTGGTVTGLTTNQTYYFVVQAVNAVGHSGNSAEVHAAVGSVPAAPTGVTATPGSGQVTLSWTAVSGATGYNIYKSTAPGQEALPAALNVPGGSSTGGTVTGLAHGQTYYFVVQAVNAVGHSGNSTEVKALSN